jgi:site-specific DNA recombinase
LFGADGAVMSPTNARKKGGKLYRYFYSQTAMKRGGGSDCPTRMVPAAEIERIVLDQVRHLVCTPEVIVQTWRAAKKLGRDITEREIRSALTEFDELWDELFPAEQARIAELLVQQVDIHPDRVDITLKIEGLTSLHGEMRSQLQQAAE